MLFWNRSPAKRVSLAPTTPAEKVVNSVGIPAKAGLANCKIIWYKYILDND